MYAKIAFIGLSTLSMCRVMVPPAAGQNVSRDRSSKIHGEGKMANMLVIRPARHILPVSATITAAWYIHLLAQGYISPKLQPWQIVATGICIAGALLRVWCYRELGRFFTYELSIREKHQLIGTGPYRYLVHPSYTAMFMTSVAWSMLVTIQGPVGWVLNRLVGVTMSPLDALVFYSLPFILLISRRVRNEEQMLLDSFKEEFVHFRQNRYRFIPFVF